MSTTIYYPQGTKIEERNTSSGSMVVTTLNVLPNNIFYFDNSGSVNSSSIIVPYTAASASYAATSSFPWVITGSNVYYSGGNVGIGTTSSTYPLDIVSTNANPFISLAASGDLFPTLRIARTNGSTKANQEWRMLIGSPGGFIWNDITNANSNVVVFQSGIPASSLVISGSQGNVGIGHNAPVYNLDVKGNLVVSVSGSTTGGGVTGDNAATFINANGVLSYGNAQFNVGTRWGQDLVFKTNNIERARISSSGNFGIGVLAPNYLLHVNTDSAGKPGVGGLWTVVSDERIKTDIELADLDRCYEIVKDVPLKHFGWNENAYTNEQVKDRHNLGWIAQDVQKVFPKAVSIIPFSGSGDFKVDDCLDLNGGQMYMAMYGALQKAIQKIEVLETRNKLMEQEVELLKRK